MSTLNIKWIISNHFKSKIINNEFMFHIDMYLRHQNKYTSLFVTISHCNIIDLITPNQIKEIMLGIKLLY